MRIQKNLFVVIGMMLFSMISYSSDIQRDSIDNFQEEKQALIISLENKIEELRTNRLKLEVKIHEHNEDLGVEIEEMVDGSYIRLKAIENQLSAELDAVKKTTVNDLERLEEAKLTLGHLSDEIETLIRKIEENLEKSTRKS